MDGLFQSFPKYSIARKEARETLYWLRLLVETKIAGQSRLPGLMKECDELIAILTAIIKKAQAKKDER